MKATERRLMDIIGDIFWDSNFEYLDGFEIVVDQRILCAMGHKPREELTELARTRMPVIAEIVVEGGKPKNRYEITIQPIGLLPEER